MQAAIAVIFVIVYAAIALEHPIKINKAASALIGAGLLWALHAWSQAETAVVVDQLNGSVMATAQIVFFLMGAMTIVEVVDAHNGFDVVTRFIKTTNLPMLLWLTGTAAFFLSAILDNLTTSIVMVTLMQKLLADREDRLLFTGIVVIAANSGGAWSPIGDVTTTMLWIGGQITPQAIIRADIIPAAVSLIVPLGITAYSLHGRSVEPGGGGGGGRAETRTTAFERHLMFCLGMGILIAVPVFKAATHLPPFLGILFGLGILWLVGDILHRNKEDVFKQRLTLAQALNRIDMASIVFFIGILLAMSVLEHTHILKSLAQGLDLAVGRLDMTVLLIGAASAVVDNVPLVAASMGMYGLDRYPSDHFLWEFLAYCAGTGGSILIIGSAAGVAAMGLEQIGFFWYARRISGLALAGYLAGAAVFLAEHALTAGRW